MSSRPIEVSKAEVEAAIERLETTPLFERSSVLLRLLRFLIKTAEARPDLLDEPYIAMELYRRDATYDPRLDSIVRVNTRRLRQRLDEYYVGAGATDPVRISVPVGGYVPVAKWRWPEQPASPADIQQNADEVLDSASATERVASEQHDALPQIASNGASSPVPAVIPWTALWLAAALGLLVSAVVVSRLHARGHVEPVSPGTGLEEVPVTMGRDLEFEPATSADGKRLAFVSRTAGSKQFRIFLRSFRPDAQDEQMLQTGSEDALYPAWSPDGQQIAFLRCGTGPCDIAVVPAAGGNIRSVRTLPTYSLPDDQGYYQYRQLNPVWTADAKGLIYPYRGLQDTAERLVLQDLASGNIVQLTSGEAADEDAAPALSPDGISVAFLRRHVAHTDVMAVDLRTRATRVLHTEPNATTSGLTWAPDGGGVVIGSVRRGGYSLLYIPLHGQPKSLNVKHPIALNPVFAKDGKTLMFLAANRTRNLAEIAGASGKPLPIFPSRQRNTFTALSPDGKVLAFLSDRSGSFEVWLSRRNGTAFLPPAQLTRGLGWYPSSITWAPDGGKLAVGISNTSEIDVADVHTGTIEHLRTPGLENSDLWSPVWSSDGLWIYVSAWGEKNGIFRISTGLVPCVEQVWAGRAREIRLDGDRVLYFEPNFGEGIYRIALNGSRQPEVVAGLRTVQPARAWFVQEGKIFYMDVHDPVTRLHSLDPSTGKGTDVTGPLPQVAFADGTLSYASRERVLIYSEWAESAGSQVIGLRWK